MQQIFDITWYYLSLLTVSIQKLLKNIRRYLQISSFVKPTVLNSKGIRELLKLTNIHIKDAVSETLRFLMDLRDFKKLLSLKSRSASLVLMSCS